MDSPEEASPAVSADELMWHYLISNRHSRDPMNILALGAHPDDLELGCFGTLLEKQLTGHKVLAVALTGAGYARHTTSEVKAAWSVARELLKAGKGKYVLGHFPIGKLQHTWETVGFVDRLIDTNDINALITHHYGEAHQDHIAAQRVAVSAARRRVDTLWLWESSIYTHRNVFPFRAQLYVPLSKESFDGKMKALKAYLTAGLIEEPEANAHRYLAQYRGAEVQREYAEAFEVVWDVHDR
jgi:LmbE family N-acetylglucosaminyl deacetylase